MFFLRMQTGKRIKLSADTAGLRHTSLGFSAYAIGMV